MFYLSARPLNSKETFLFWQKRYSSSNIYSTINREALRCPIFYLLNSFIQLAKKLFPFAGGIIAIISPEQLEALELLFRVVDEPGLSRQPFGLKGPDKLGLAQGLADVVQALQQRLASEFVHLEGEALPGGDDDLLG